MKNWAKEGKFAIRTCDQSTAKLRGLFITDSLRANHSKRLRTAGFNFSRSFRLRRKASWTHFPKSETFLTTKKQKTFYIEGKTVWIFFCKFFLAGFPVYTFKESNVSFFEFIMKVIFYWWKVKCRKWLLNRSGNGNSCRIYTIGSRKHLFTPRLIFSQLPVLDCDNCRKKVCF